MGTFPPAFNEDLTLREMKASFKSNKGALTRLSNQVKVRAETFIAIKSPGSATQLNESYSSWRNATSCTTQPTNWPWKTRTTPSPGCKLRSSSNRCRTQLNASTETPKYN